MAPINDTAFDERVTEHQRGHPNQSEMNTIGARDPAATPNQQPTGSTIPNKQPPTTSTHLTNDRGCECSPHMAAMSELARCIGHRRVASVSPKRGFLPSKA